ncbi:MAG: class I SAM-dependent methyltransferase [Candidatus Scalinduaceae bacterium]
MGKNDSTCEQEPQGLVTLSMPGTHEKIIQFLQNEKKGKLLDVPAGTGILSMKLKGIGFECYGCDINAEGFKAKDIEFRVGNLNKRIPFETNCFDYITCIDGLEHLENPHNAIREFKRILKKGGKLFISIPNYLNIERRMKYLITGSFTKPVSQEMFEERFNCNTTMMHINLIGYPLLRFMLESNDFCITKLDIDKRKPKMIFLSPITALIKLYCWFWPKKAKERYWLKETLSKEILLGGNTLIVVAEK